MDSTWISFIAVVICSLIGATMSMRSTHKAINSEILAGMSSTSSSKRQGKVKIQNLAPGQVAFDHSSQSGGSGLSGKLAGVGISHVERPGKAGTRKKGTCRIEAKIEDNILTSFVQYTVVPNVLSLEATITYHPLYVKYHIDHNTNMVTVSATAAYLKIQVEWGSRLFRRSGKFNVDLQKWRMVNARATFNEDKSMGKCEFSLPFKSDLTGANVEYDIPLGEVPKDLRARLRHAVNEAINRLLCAFFKHVWNEDVQQNPNTDVISEIEALTYAGYFFDESDVEDSDDQS